MSGIPFDICLVLYGDPQKAVEDLQTFAKLNEQRLYKLLKTCQDIHSDLKTLVKAYVRDSRSLHSVRIDC